MKLRLAKSGPAVDVPTFLGAILLVDLLLALALAIGAPFLALTGRWTPVPSWIPWAAGAFGLLVAAADLAAARLKPKGLTWRRRLGFVAMGAVVWRGGPVTDRFVQAGLIVYLGVVWTALVVGGRTLSRAIATATGEDKPE